jgi:hypothetical protein
VLVRHDRDLGVLQEQFTPYPCSPGSARCWAYEWLDPTRDFLEIDSWDRPEAEMIQGIPYLITGDPRPWLLVRTVDEFQTVTGHMHLHEHPRVGTGFILRIETPEQVANPSAQFIFGVRDGQHRTCGRVGRLLDPQGVAIRRHGHPDGQEVVNGSMPCPRQGFLVFGQIVDPLVLEC